jgi:MSHA pilin protein MshD
VTVFANSRGFTLVESIVTMLIVSIAVLALSTALSVGFSHSSDGLVHAKTVELAQAYLDEIQSRRFAEATPLGGVPPCSTTTVACGAIGNEGEARDQFDDVDDYDGLDESPPRNAQGDALVNYTGYRVQVDVAFATAAQVAALNLDSPTDAKIVTVTVVTPSGGSVAFPVVRANF